MTKDEYCMDLCETCMKLIVHFIHKKPVVIIYQLLALATVIFSMRKGVATISGGSHYKLGSCKTWNKE